MGCASLNVESTSGGNLRRQPPTPAATGPADIL
jgi:hypothetical protein